MKLTHYLYADFETTQVDTKNYLSAKEYYEKEENPETPKVYSWTVGYNSEYGKLVDGHNFTENSKYAVDRNIQYGYNHHTNIHNEELGDTFIDFIENIDKDVLMYFNNLKGFDGHFLIPMLDARGYFNVLPFNIEDLKNLTEEEREGHLARILRIRTSILSNKQNLKMYESLRPLKAHNKWILEKIKKQWNKLLPYEYTVMTNGNNQIYEIKIGIKSKKVTKGTARNRAVIIRDNLLLFPTSVANMGKTIVMQELGDKLAKGAITKDEHKKWIKLLKEDKLSHFWLKEDLKTKYTRKECYKNYEELVNDKNELSYLIKDAMIIWQFHNLLENHFPRKDWQQTIGSSSYKLWEQTLGNKLILKAIEKGDVKVIRLERGAIRYEYKDKEFDTFKLAEYLIKGILPTKWLDRKHSEQYDTVHDFLYDWYDGGITHVNEKYRGQLVEYLTFLDINSSYPSQMVKDVDIPIGEGVEGNVAGYDFKFYTLIPKKKIVNKKGLPFLYNHLSDQREYLKTLLPNTEYKFTSITLPRFLKYYECKKSDYTLKVEYSFKTTKIKNLFADFILKWYEIKEQASDEGNEIIKFLSKLFMNSLYGKFGTKSSRDSKIWNQYESIWEGYTQTVDSKYYLPIAIAITELARMALVDAVDLNYENFVYTDTDSIAVINFKNEDYTNIELHPSELGKWDIEKEDMYGVFRRPKQYFIKNDRGDVKKAFAGINFNKLSLPDEELAELNDIEKELLKVNILDFIVGKEIPKQIRPFRLLGKGLIFEEIEKNIKPIWDYDPLTEQIHFKEEHFKESIKKIKNKYLN